MRWAPRSSPRRLRRLLVLASDGKIFTLEAAKLPGGRGAGEPIRLMADLDESAEIVAVWLYARGREDAGRDQRRARLCRRPGRDAVVDAQGQGGPQRRRAGASARLATPASGDHVAMIGENRKLLVFPLAQTPEMARGKGVRLQRYKDGGLSDARVFKLAEGMTWRDSAGRAFTVAKADLKDWIGDRAEAGRLPPKGFPKSNRFEG